MPLLSAEPRAFPESLFSDPTSLAADGQWWVLYTRSRMEKALARQLRAKEVPFYLPLYEQTWKSRGRRRTSYLPLFPGYVFLHGGDSARIAALETNLLCATLPVVDQDRLFDDLNRVERVLGGSVPVNPEETLPPGTPVEVAAGSFQGLRGTVIRRNGQTRLYIEVEFLRRGVSIEVEEWALRALTTRTEPRDQR
ncbi:MAG: antitermination protein NusG [Planctomycetia bacterium]|nr:antitermination protein NusG [Planctomycetia bacterium]